MRRCDREQPVRLSRLVMMFTAAAFMLQVVQLFARAGGSGGGSGGGGGDSGGGGSGGGDAFFLIYLIITLIRMGPVGWFILAVLAVIAYLVYKNSKTSTIYNSMRVTKPLAQVKGYSDFLTRNSGFDMTEFTAKVNKAFVEIQNAWSNMNLAPVRRYISDGVYQRFHTQFKMMEILKQKNLLSHVTIHSISVDRVEKDGDFDILHVRIAAGMSDQFVCETIPSLDTYGGYENFIEYWSFIRKRGQPKKDIYQTDNCPNCSAPLSKDMTDAGKCTYCGSFVNSGEYDWVLSEITQADDYTIDVFHSQKTQSLPGKVGELIGGNKDFSVQMIEDKASNGYLQIITSIILKDPAIMRRFVTDSAFEKIKARMKDDKIVYNRLFLNSVTLLGAKQEAGKNLLMIGIKSSFQRVKLLGENQAVLVDTVINSRNEVLFMERDIQAVAAKGSIYARMCGACGAPSKDSLDVKCAYCGILLNSSKNEWIISDIMSMEEFRAYAAKNASTFDVEVKAPGEDELYDVRDYAFNNVMMMIGADGVFAAEEQEYALKLAKKWGYNTNLIKNLVDMAIAKRLVVRMPENMNKRKKIYNLMAKTAESDGSVAPLELSLLDEIKAGYIQG